MHQRVGLTIILVVCIAAIVTAIFVDPITQDPGYHLFTDARTIVSIPNFLNVISNLPLLIVGLIGLKRVLNNQVQIIDNIKPAYLVLFMGISLTALGSAYYHHWQPDNQSLVWDRIPMTLAFMSLFSIIVAEFICVRTAKFILLPLLMLGVYSVIHWHSGDIEGQGDLRLYALIQFLPVVLITIILISYPSTFSRHTIYWMLLGYYVLAKLTEHFDGQIYAALSVISGHSLKHIIAAVGLWILLDGYTKRIKKHI